MLRPKLNRIWTSSSSTARRDPGDAKYIQGWISEIPTFQVLNYLQYKVDTTLLAHAERGFFEWGSDVTYIKGAIAFDELDKQIYVSQVVGPSKTLAPSKNTAQWKVSSIQITREEYDTIVAAINAHIADVTGNPHQLTPGRLGAYTKAETDALVTTYRNLVNAHASNNNNPHGTTAAQVGAVPITGGTYTGDVIFSTGQILLDSGSANKVGLLSGNGLYLQSGSGLLGIDSTGTAVAGTAAAPSPIVTEKTFADLKEDVEPNYSSPAPMFYMPLMGDVNIYTGAGTTQCSFDPVWNQYGFQMLIGVSGNVNVSNPLLVGASQVVVALDFNGGGSNASTQLMHAGVGNSSSTGMCRIGFDGAGRIAAYGGSVSTYSPKGYFDGKTHRAVVRKDATGIFLYVDGVLVASATTATVPPIATTNELIYHSSSLTSDAALTFCNLRVWAANLTDKQISNL